VIELTILSQMHFSEFNLGAWLCLNLGCKVVGCGRAAGGHCRSPPHLISIETKLAKFPKLKALGATTITNWGGRIITKAVLDRLNMYLCPIFAACHLDKNW
jgi:hypothetical protein